MDKNELEFEIDKYGDILQLEFTESHYNLPLKDLAFLDFIQKKCNTVSFVFKGDDDILGKRINY